MLRDALSFKELWIEPKDCHKKIVEVIEERIVYVRHVEEHGSERLQETREMMNEVFDLLGASVRVVVALTKLQQLMKRLAELLRSHVRTNRRSKLA